MLDTTALRAAGTSPAAIAHHYDEPDEFFALWLGDERVYSCALWSDDPADTLALAQQRKLDWFADALRVRGGHVLDIGCGWGALLQRFIDHHHAVNGVGLTLSAAQAACARRRDVPGTDFRVESWIDHQPCAPYDAITCIEMSEHLASDTLTPDAKVDVYRAFFERCAAWLRDGGRLGLQLICLDNVGHAGSRAGRGAASELIRVDIFPESMPGSLAELVLGWETHFQLERFIEHHDHYRRTFRAWGLNYRAADAQARGLVGDATARTFARYFAAGETFFRLREHSLYRVILKKRATPKRWVAPLRYADIATSDTSSAVERASASPAAVRAHYDVSNDFYALWLGPTMMYTSGLWNSPADDPHDVEAACLRKIDFFAEQTQIVEAARVLDIGCGWGGNLRRVCDSHGVRRAVGLTLSPAQQQWLSERPISGAEIRLEDWNDHVPEQLYDAILSYGAFEHFARDGTAAVERVRAYRRFFASCFSWLKPGGRLGLESIAHDDAPDTAAPLGRGPLGDTVYEIFPESICPHLSELVLGFEPYFEIELLRSDSPDFARTMRLWHLALRAQEMKATDLVGTDVVRRFRRYLIASEVQFRAGTITNCRVVLRRRPALRW